MARTCGAKTSSASPGTRTWQQPGEELPPKAFTVRYPQLDPDWDFDFDDEAEMRRRLPRLADLYYQPAEAG
jgi:hypothetical protein